MALSVREEELLFGILFYKGISTVPVLLGVKKTEATDKLRHM